MQHTKDTVISTEGEEIVGNDANRFDEWRQSGTLGPTPPTASGPPPETGGSDGGAPNAGT